MLEATADILKQIESRGFFVSIHHLPADTLGTPTIQMHAGEPNANPPELRIARVEGEGDEVELRCACVLAEMVGVPLE